ncbi:MAG: LytTR family transcriptional regulator [Firmicutes bacterium]|jgi:DNA-binding LytR/AlgR family response regulator|nr:LytTR family transcriptional regulator [Bacillota bacterium]
MRLKLRVSIEREPEIIKELQDRNIEISENAEFVLIEDTDEDKIRCRKDNEIIVVSLHEICYIESLGRDVFIHLYNGKCYKSDKRLYQFEGELSSDDFIRISNSVIIARKSIKKIKPSLSCKYLLTLEDNSIIDVTRTYYYKFKDFFGI